MKKVQSPKSTTQEIDGLLKALVKSFGKLKPAEIIRKAFLLHQRVLLDWPNISPKERVMILQELSILSELIKLHGEMRWLDITKEKYGEAI